MSERRQKTVVVFQSDLREHAPDNLIEFIAWAQGLLEQIPAEYRDTATIDIDSVGGEEYHYAEIAIAYSRPETSDERRERLENQRRRASSSLDHHLKYVEIHKRELEEIERQCPPAQPD